MNDSITNTTTLPLGSGDGFYFTASEALAADNTTAYVSAANKVQMMMLSGGGGISGLQLACNRANQSYVPTGTSGVATSTATARSTATHNAAVVRSAGGATVSRSLVWVAVLRFCTCLGVGTCQHANLILAIGVGEM